MPTSKELRELRAPLIKEIRSLADKIHAEKRDFNAEEKVAWDKVNADYDLQTRQIEVAERAERLEADSRTASQPEIGRENRSGRVDPLDSAPVAQPDKRDAPTDEHRALALQAWCRSGAAMELTDRHEDACKRMRFNPHQRWLDVPLPTTERIKEIQAIARGYRTADREREYRAMSAVNAATGGTFVPPATMVRSLEQALLFFGGIMEVAEIINTASGEPLQWPTADDTTNSGVQLGESAAVTTQDPATAARTWGAYKFSSKEIKVPQELLEDSAFDVAAVIGEMLGTRLRRILNTKFTTGTGAATPNGIVTSSTAGKTTASATAIAADELIDLEHSVDVAYRMDPSTGYMFHDLIKAVLRKLKDGNGQYLWQPGMSTGAPDRINGFPYTINNDMQSTVATATKTALFGQMNKYKVRMVGSVRLYRLDERHRENDQTAFISFIRADGNLLTAGVQPIKHLLQA